MFGCCKAETNTAPTAAANEDADILERGESTIRRNTDSHRDKTHREKLIITWKEVLCEMDNFNEAESNNSSLCVRNHVHSICD